MFEDALMESSSTIKTRSKYWSVPALALNCTLLSALIIWPLLHPEALPKQAIASLLVAPPPPLAPPPQTPATRTVPRAQVFEHELEIPNRIPHEIKLADEAAPPPLTGVVGINMTGNGADNTMTGIVVDGSGHSSVIQAPPPPKVILPSGVMAGSLLDKVTPQYPAIAREARVQGIVVLQATISKTGTIENLRVLSGPPLLQQAALDAVRSWRYKPYSLNGEPVAVETTVNVIFNLGN